MMDTPESRPLLKLVLGLLVCALAAYGLVTLIDRYMT